LALRMFISQDGASQYGPMFAMSILSILPILIFFLLFQRLIIRGIAMSGLK
jgi:multiple sugar transport system permease protein